MTCSKCGQELTEGAKFCTKCGSSVNGTTLSVSGTASGKKLLKITGILFIIFGTFNIISLITNIVTGFSELASGFTIFLGILNVLLNLFLGITGVMYCNDIKKAKLLKYFAICYIGFCVIFYISTIIITVAKVDIDILDILNLPSELLAITILSTMTGFVVPILYLIGAQKNLKVQEGQLIGG